MSDHRGRDSPPDHVGIVLSAAQNTTDISKHHHHHPTMRSPPRGCAYHGQQQQQGPYDRPRAFAQNQGRASDRGYYTRGEYGYGRRPQQQPTSSYHEPSSTNFSSRAYSMAPHEPQYTPQPPRGHHHQHGAYVVGQAVPTPHASQRSSEGSRRPSYWNQLPPGPPSENPFVNGSQEWVCIVARCQLPANASFFADLDMLHVVR